MRKILFRAKRIDNRKWVEGHYFKNENGTFIFDFPYHANYADIDIMVRVDPDTVCQYAGLKDENGTKIFEGDIITNVDSGNIGVVKFGVYHLKHYGFYIEWIGNIHYRNDICFWTKNRLINVNGNIYDNPELLERESEK